LSNNNLQARKPQFSEKINTAAYQNLIAQTIPDEKRRNRFLSSILSAVAVNPALKECEPGTILAAAFLGESLGLSPSPQLGQYYMIPFENKKKGVKEAVFVTGYKGYLQMAIRSGAYRNIIVTPVKRGELVKFNRITEEITLKPIEDDVKWEAEPTTGYYAKAELVSGFVKEIYWSREKMQIHADKYSKAYSMQADLKLKDGKIPQSDLWKYSSFWYRDFDTMAMKTLIRQLIGKWGVLSQELSDGYTRDGSVNYENGAFEIADIGLADSENVQEVPEIVEEQGEEKVQTEESGGADGQKEISFDDL